MTAYECTIIVRHDMSPNDVNKLSQTLGQIITDNGGKIAKTEQWGLRSLAYPINKANKGHYVMLGLEAPHAAIVELERQIRINEDVIRFLTVRVEKMDSKPSIVLRQKSGENVDEAA